MLPHECFHCPQASINNPAKYLDYCSFLHLLSLILSYPFQSLIRKVTITVKFNGLIFSAHFLVFVCFCFFSLAFDSGVYPCPYWNFFSLSSWDTVTFCHSLHCWDHSSLFSWHFLISPSLIWMCALNSVFILLFSSFSDSIFFVAHILFSWRCTEEWAMYLWVALLSFTRKWWHGYRCINPLEDYIAFWD